jgi:hypothetical protein
VLAKTHLDMCSRLVGLALAGVSFFGCTHGRRVDLGPMACSAVHIE